MIRTGCSCRWVFCSAMLSLLCSPPTGGDCATFCLSVRPSICNARSCCSRTQCAGNFLTARRHFMGNSVPWKIANNKQVGQIILAKGCIARGRLFTDGTTWCDTDQSVALQSAAAVVLWCRCWFFCSIQRKIDSQCISVGRIIPKIVPFYLGSGFPSNTWFIWFIRVYSLIGISIGSRTWRTDTQTCRLRYSVCSNRPHLAIAITVRSKIRKSLTRVKRYVKTNVKLE